MVSRTGHHLRSRVLSHHTEASLQARSRRCGTRGEDVEVALEPEEVSFEQGLKKDG